MDLREALDVVLSLAQDNALDPVCQDIDLQIEADRQTNAITTILKFYSTLEKSS